MDDLRIGIVWMTEAPRPVIGTRGFRMRGDDGSSEMIAAGLMLDGAGRIVVHRPQPTTFAPKRCIRFPVLQHLLPPHFIAALHCGAMRSGGFLA